MAGETYYFVFSLIFALGITLHIFNMAYFRVTKRTILGYSYRPGTDEYKKFAKYSSVPGLSIAVIIALVLLANLVFDIERLLHLSDRVYSHGVLIIMPLFVVVIFVGTMITNRSKFGPAGSLHTANLSPDKRNAQMKASLKRLSVLLGITFLLILFGIVFPHIHK
jgi:hypothetical protein